MCFSATVSFVAGVSLTVLGVVTVKKTERKVEIPFAMIPLLFGAQKIVEGMLWLSFQFSTPLLNASMTYFFYAVLACSVANLYAILNRLNGNCNLA